jgi:hypothetical protein
MPGLLSNFEGDYQIASIEIVPVYLPTNNMFLHFLSNTIVDIKIHLCFKKIRKQFILSPV